MPMRRSKYVKPGAYDTTAKPSVPRVRKKLPPKPKPPAVKKPFVAWDGEGVNLHGEWLPQSYTLFGCSTGQRLISPDGLRTEHILPFIIDVGKNNPGVHHVSFAFNYDVNMIMRTVDDQQLSHLHAKGWTYLHYPTGTYRVHYLKGKWFRVTKVEEDQKHNFTVTIDDMFSFFGCSFIKAYEQMVGDIPVIVTEGKARRSQFARNELDQVEAYWRVEIDMMRKLAQALQDNLYSANLPVTRWYGPGVLATYVLRKYRTEDHMMVPPDEVYDAARFAYAGGRFEMFRLGRHHSSPVYAVDINSAYPHAIAKLPSLKGGTWRRCYGPPTNPEAFSLHHVTLGSEESFMERIEDGHDRIGPLFHRAEDGSVSFPHNLRGWYWAPEVFEAVALNDPELVVGEGWEFVPITDQKPFSWVSDMFALRLEWKKSDNPAQIALKLCMNSLYGKLAQRVGWEWTGSAPKYHQLDWAGWVTSFTRATLFRVMNALQPGSVIACETDSIYTTDPNITNIVNVSDRLGDWGLDVYDEVIYLQSGIAWLRQGDTWTGKHRGLDKDSVTHELIVDYVKSLGPLQMPESFKDFKSADQWGPLVGRTTRFTTLGAALASAIPTKAVHCLWRTTDREIHVGTVGKRTHERQWCDACAAGLTAYDGTHSLSVTWTTGAYIESTRHDIPWLGPDLQIRTQYAQQEDEDGIALL